MLKIFGFTALHVVLVYMLIFFRFNYLFPVDIHDVVVYGTVSRNFHFIKKFLCYQGISLILLNGPSPTAMFLVLCCLAVYPQRLQFLHIGM